jgi:hypothetical protein
MEKFSKKMYLTLLALGFSATQAMADATLTAPTFALDDVGVVGGALLVGMAGFWAIKKGIGLARA